jgi:hypothetical protein
LLVALLEGLLVEHQRRDGSLVPPELTRDGNDCSGQVARRGPTTAEAVVEE